MWSCERMLILPPNTFGSFECIGQSVRLVYTYEELRSAAVNQLTTIGHAPEVSKL